MLNNINEIYSLNINYIVQELYCYILSLDRLMESCISVQQVSPKFTEKKKERFTMELNLLGVFPFSATCVEIFICPASPLYFLYFSFSFQPPVPSSTPQLQTNFSFIHWWRAQVSCYVCCEKSWNFECLNMEMYCCYPSWQVKRFSHCTK